MKSFLLIGAGDFGHLLARELSKQPCELMIADINEDALGDLLELGISAKIGDCSREEVLESFDVASFDACFVCVGGHFQTSLEIVYLLEKLHAKKIHCKADDDSQAKFLSIIGADHVIYPEREAAQSLAISEANDSIFNCIPMTDGYGVYEIATPGSWVNKTFKEASIYQIYRVNILATVNDGVISMMPPSSYRFNARDHLMVLGHQADIYDIPLSEIDEFPDHPFQVRMDEDMDQLVESVKERGVITPVTLRRKEDDRYETVSGHRRIKACELAGLETVPAEIKELTRDEAILLMVDSNLQRSYILPSEKAMAYKMRLDAMRRMPGRPTKTDSQKNLTPVVSDFEKPRTSEELANEVGESREQIRRYIRLTELAPDLLQMVDEGKIAMRPAVELSYLNDIEQQDLIAAIDEADATPSHAQAIKMRNFSKEGKLNPEVIESIMMEEKPNQRPKISFKYEELKQYMPSDISYERTTKFVIEALQYYKRHLDRKRDQER